MCTFPIKDLIHSSLFRGITEDELTAMLDCLSGHIREYKKDSSIFRWGDRITQIGLILKGNVQHSQGKLLGKRITFGQTWAGGFVR